MTESEIELDVEAAMENGGMDMKSTEINDQIGETQMEANTSSENKVYIDQLVKNIVDCGKHSDRKSASSTKPCIYKIPEHLRKVNARAYTPTLVSIGPFHHRNEKFETMGELKLRYFERFIDRENQDLGEWVKVIVERKEKIRSCYAEMSDSPCSHSGNNYFERMILFDVIFIIELFLGFYPEANIIESDESNQESQNSRDPMKAEPWMLSVVPLDLVLLENQLPYFVIEDIYKTVFTTVTDARPSLIVLVLNFFKDFRFQDTGHVKVKHFTDLLRTSYLGIPQTLSQPSAPSKSKGCCWFAGITRGSVPVSGLRKRNGASSAEPKRCKVRTLMFSATQLREAGVKFERSISKSLLDLDFDVSNGVLKIPGLELNDSAEARIRNVMAYEQFDLGEKIFITGYFIILDFLINTPKDMDLLIDKEIVDNPLGDSKVATSVVNRLNCGVSWLGIDPKYSDICGKLNDFGKTTRHRWIAILRHEYFNTPWRGAATVAAFMLLLLTLIQSVCSVLQVVGSRQL